MSDIKCPNCGKTFNIDEADYASILNQVRDEAFEKAVKERSALFDQDKKTAIELAEAKLSSQMEKEVARRDAEIGRLKSEISTNAELIKATAAGKLIDEVSKKDVEMDCQQ